MSIAPPSRHLLVLLAWLAVPAAAPGAGSVTAAVTNSAPAVDLPSAGMIFYDHMECSAALIGCRTVLTAAHCLCYDDAFSPPRLQVGDDCRTRSDLVDPASKRVFFPHAGTFGVSEIDFHPGWGEIPGEDDLAILHLDRPVDGVPPALLDEAGPPARGSRGVVAGFGRTTRDREDQGILRAGPVTFTACGDASVCWWLLDPPDPTAGDAGLCYHDSGGPVFAEIGAGPPVLAGVNRSTSASDCRTPALNRSTSVLFHRDWIVATAGDDLGSGTCGVLPPAGGPGTRLDGATGAFSEGRPEAIFTFDVPPGTGLLRVTVTATGTVQPGQNDVDLLVRHGRAPGPGRPADCTSAGEGPELCALALPEPGRWYALVRRVRGEGRFQIVTTQYDEVDAPATDPPGGDPTGPATPPPEPPAGPWLAAAGLPGFEAKARFHGGETPLPAAAVADCIPESLCLSGALAGRPELFVKVIGPRPNGFLWVQISRFTPSRVELWLRRRATGRVNYYELDAVGAAAAGVPGLQDRRAFRP